MQEKHLFEYAVIRIVPRVEREEFLNVGVILYCSKLNFLEALFDINTTRLKAFCGQLDIAEVEENLRALQRICAGGEGAGPIGKLDRAARFRWLTAVRSASIQTSRPHPGVCDDLEGTIKTLFEEMVG